jgi:hypothetical protein
MTTLEEKKKNRWLMLKKFYEICNGQSNTYIVDMWEVGQELGWDRETTSATYDYLEGERLLKAMTLGGGATITHHGVKEVEQAEEFPEKPTLHFPPMIVNIMRDSYTVNQAGAVGPNAYAHDMNFKQIGNKIEKSVDLEQLANELSRLRQAMKKEGNQLEHDIAISDIAKAEQAAKTNNSAKVAEHLQSAGKWALDIASKIGVSLAIEALKQATGIGK